MSKLFSRRGLLMNAAAAALLAPLAATARAVWTDEDCVVHYSVDANSSHDGFPAYELFVGSQLVDRSTPAEIGGINNPSALFGDSDVTVPETSGTLPDNSGPSVPVISIPLNQLGD